MHCGYIVEVKELKPHSNADKLQLATFFGETVIVGLDTKIGDIGIYFPCDIQLSEKYCDANDLCRKKADGSDGNGYLERDKRNVKAINLRGERSFGLYAPLESLAWAGDISTLKVGDTIDIWNGKEICKKYIPAVREGKAFRGQPNRSAKRAKRTIAPTFFEHADTEQLAYNLFAFKPGDEVEITLKMHGTSQRTGYHKVLKGFKKTIWDRIFRREGTPIYDWDYVSGTRRVVLETYDGGFYGDNAFRKQHADTFEGKLWKGETVYYEVVSYTHTGAPIMATASVPKEYQKIYGKIMDFNYGCTSPNSDIYVYRMTMTNEDGNTIEYTPDFMRYRCEMMGVKTVPVMWVGRIPENPGSADDDTISAGEWIKNVAERFYDGPDPIGKTHVREGVVVRILNRPTFKAYKHKNWLFKYISGIAIEKIADSNVEIDMDILSEM